MGEWNRQKQDRWVKIDETSEKEAFGWVRTSPGVAANWKYVNYLLTWPQNRQQGRGWEIGQPPPFSWQISELDARLWPSRVVRAPRPNQLPASNPSQDSTCQPNKQHLLSPSYIRRPSRQDHMLTSLVIGDQDLLSNISKSHLLTDCQTTVQTYNKLYFTLSLSSSIWNHKNS